MPDYPNSVSYTVTNSTAVINIDNPPVNALSHNVRLGIEESVNHFISDTTANIAIIVCSGRSFIAGADISEFGKTPKEPTLPQLTEIIENSPKPIIAVMHGTPLGGGLEIALAAHYRIADANTNMGLPEVKLGLLPGAGGTQRLPRLVGLEMALDMITSGRTIDAQTALEHNLIDTIFDSEDLKQAGLEFAEKIQNSDSGIRKTSEIKVKQISESIFDVFRDKLIATSRGQISPLKCVDAVQSAMTMPFKDGLKHERNLFLELLNSPQRDALVHAFFAERSTSKIPELNNQTPRKIEKIGIIGGGTMGAGIAASCLLSNFAVHLIERDQAAAQNAFTSIEKILNGAVNRQLINLEKKQHLLNTQFSTGIEYQQLEDRDLVVEAVFEDMAVKQTVFEKLDKVCKDDAILATNTSYLDINQIADVTKRPENVIGLHFFSPAHIMKLLEIIATDTTALDVTASCFDFAKKLRKTAVLAGVCDGFIGNRILAKYRMAADYMVIDGASPYQIDKALTEFGFAMGPFAVSDLAGLDIGWATRKRKAPTLDSRTRIVKFADTLCELGHFGRKTGRGFYSYENNPKQGEPNPEAETIIEQERQQLGITAKQFTNDEILRRYMAAMINEAANVLDEGIARRPLDIDVTFLAGYGFPRHYGGPMKYADQYGLEKVLDDLYEFSKEDNFFWGPSKLIKQLVEKKQLFQSLN